MLTVKTETYSFLANEPLAPTFIDYMRDKYEWGGAEVEVENDDGLIHVTINYIEDIDNHKLKDFEEYRKESK